MKLELESLEYDRVETGIWTARFTVRNDKDRQVLAFSEHCTGATEGRETGWTQAVSAEQALTRLFAQARTTLRTASEAI